LSARLVSSGSSPGARRQPCLFGGKPTRSAGSASDRGPEAARQRGPFLQERLNREISGGTDVVEILSSRDAGRLT